MILVKLHRLPAQEYLVSSKVFLDAFHFALSTTVFNRISQSKITSMKQLSCFFLVTARFLDNNVVVSIHEYDFFVRRNELK